MQKRTHITFSGQVQGVGFRFTAESIAQKLGIKGWVKNLRSGEVEVMAEGEETALKDFISQIQGQLGGYVSDTDVIWQEFLDEFKDFGIKF